VADFSTGDSYAVSVIKVGRSELRTERPVSWATRQNLRYKVYAEGFYLAARGRGNSESWCCRTFGKADGSRLTAPAAELQFDGKLTRKRKRGVQ
jgi:hypothetical protein